MNRRAFWNDNIMYMDSTSLLRVSKNILSWITSAIFRHCTDFQDYKHSFIPLSKKELNQHMQSQCSTHTPSIAFRHFPPNSARFGYATEGAHFISAQLSTDAVSALRKVWVLERVSTRVVVVVVVVVAQPDCLPTLVCVPQFCDKKKCLTAGTWRLANQLGYA